eukprot:402079-Rhodomonas_salina.1
MGYSSLEGPGRPSSALPLSTPSIAIRGSDTLVPPSQYPGTASLRTWYRLWDPGANQYPGSALWYKQASTEVPETA